MTIRRLLSASILGISIVGLAPLGVAAQSSSAEQAAERDARAATMRSLGRVITVDLNDARLEDIIQFLRDFSGATIDVMWLDDQANEGLQKDQRLTISAKDSTVLAFLERILEKSQTEFSPNTWQFTREGNGIEIGPKSRLNSKAFLKMYDVNDMLYQIPDFVDAPSLDLDQVLNQGQQGSSGASGGIFQDANNNEGGVGPTTEELAQNLMNIITENIEPEQWQDNGGTGGTIRFYNGFLLIRAPDYIHRQLTGYPAPTPTAAGPSAGN
jgi:hypothetical protein